MGPRPVPLIVASEKIAIPAMLKRWRILRRILPAIIQSRKLEKVKGFTTHLLPMNLLAILHTSQLRAVSCSGIPRPERFREYRGSDCGF